MKNCPFCKNSISENNDICPHCRRILVERIYSNPTSTPYTNSQNTKTATNGQLNYFKRLNDRLKNLNRVDFKKYVPILALVLLIIFISTQKLTPYNPTPISVIPNNEESLGGLPKLPTLPKLPPLADKVYTSLPNGAALSKNSYYFNGFGQLKIDNGTNLDAIAKLVNTTTNKSVLTVHIKAKNIYNISKISDGNYKLFFNLGNDWDAEVKAFIVNSSYEVFEERFDFTTTEYEEGDYIRTRYTSFSVTLNPVVGGHAKTDKINAIDFGSY